MVEKRKRAPGGGRKPLPPGSGNSAALSVRVRNDVRAGLEREAKRNRVSLSHEIQKRLEASLDNMGRKREDKLYGWEADEIARNRAFAALVGQLAARIESDTGKSWRTDRYTFDALCAGLEILLSHLRPAGEVTLPARIRESIDRLGKHGAQLAEPGGVASMVALGMIYQLQTSSEPPVAGRKNDHYAEEFYVFPAIRKALGITGGGK